MFWGYVVSDVTVAKSIEKENYLEVFGVFFVVDDRGYALHCFDADDTFEREIRLQAQRSRKVIGGD